MPFRLLVAIRSKKAPVAKPGRSSNLELWQALKEGVQPNGDDGGEDGRSLRSHVLAVVLPAAEVWAKANGCAGSIVESREGWARALKPHGYEVHQVAVRKVF